MRHTILFLFLAAACFAQPSLYLVACTDTGGDDTYVCTSGYSLAALSQSVFYVLTATQANDGAATLNIDSLGATAIKCGGSTDCAANVIPGGGMPVILRYDGTYFQVAGGGGGGSGENLPSQSGQSGKVLYTNGTAASWILPAAGDLVSIAVGGGSMTFSGDTAVLVQYSLASSAPTGACDPVAFVSVTGGDLYACVAGAWVQLAPASHSHAASAITSGTLDAARLPLPGASTLGGVKANTGGAGQFVNGINTSTGELTYGSVGSGYGTVLWGSANGVLNTTLLPASTAKWISNSTLQNGISGAYMIVPANGTLRDLYVYCSGTQGRDAAIEFELFKAPATATGIKVTVANGATSNIYSDTSNTYALSAGEAVSLRLFTTSTTGTGCTFGGWSARIQ